MRTPNINYKELLLFIGLVICSAAMAYWAYKNTPGVQSVDLISQFEGDKKEIFKYFSSGASDFKNKKRPADICVGQTGYRKIFCISGYFHESFLNKSVFELMSHSTQIKSGLEAMMFGFVLSERKIKINLSSLRVNQTLKKYIADGWGFRESFSEKLYLETCEQYFSAEYKPYCEWGLGRGHYLIGTENRNQNSQQPYSLGFLFEESFYSEEVVKKVITVYKMSQKLKGIWSQTLSEVMGSKDKNCLLKLHVMDCLKKKN